MAGNYMDAPDDRIAYDRDGSLAVVITGAGSITALNAAQRQGLNSENETPLNTQPVSWTRLAVVFSVPHDLTAAFIASSYTSAGIYEGQSFVQIETSKDSTTGLDGTWTNHTVGGAVNTWGPTKPNYRILDRLRFFLPGAESADVRAVRITWTQTTQGTGNNAPRVLHLYGRPSSAATTDRLALWHPTTDTRLPATAFDWGDVARGSSADKTFRIKNLSDHLNATDIDVYVEALTPGSPSVASMHTLSIDEGATYESSLNLPLLEPGEISPVIRLRRVVPSNAQVSVFSARVGVDVNLWEEA